MTEVYDYLYEDGKVYTVPKGGAKEDFIFVKDEKTAKVLESRFMLPVQSAR